MVSLTVFCFSCKKFLHTFVLKSNFHSPLNIYLYGYLHLLQYITATYTYCNTTELLAIQQLTLLPTPTYKQVGLFNGSSWNLEEKEV